MAHQIRGKLRFEGVKDGQPVFTEGGRSRPARVATGTAPVAKVLSELPSAPGKSNPATPVESNTYPGKCGSCTGWVAAGKGERRSDPHDRVWKTFHLAGECTRSAVPAKEQGVYDAPVRIPIPDGAEMRPSLFTLEDDQGHITMRILRQKPDDRFKPGTDLIGYLSGTDNTADYQTFGEISSVRGSRQVVVWKRYAGNERLIAAIRRIVTDPDSVRHAKLCTRCGEVLTNPASLDAWIGPWCRKQDN